MRGASAIAVSEAVFSSASMAAVVAWCLLVAGAALPQGRWRDWALLAGGRTIPLALCLLYAVLILTRAPLPTGSGYDSLAAVMRLNSVPGGVLTGWTHFLALDLLAGRWVVDHAARKGWPTRACALLVLPVTAMYAPVGLLAYLVVQRVCRANGIMPRR